MAKLTKKQKNTASKIEADKRYAMIEALTLLKPAITLFILLNALPEPIIWCSAGM
jgi:hypothetical protein